jgi:multiple sugar transport system substrate-binding protein
LAATDLAILVAFCRAYIAGQPFPSPAPNSKIVDELVANGIYLDLDSLRGHLRHLYARFGVEEGLTPGEKRVRLVELVYENNVIPGWGQAVFSPADQPASASSEAASAPGATPQRPSTTPAADTSPSLRPFNRTLTAVPSPYRWAMLGLAAALIGALLFALIASLGDGEGDGSVHRPSGVGMSTSGAPPAKIIDTRSARTARGPVNYCTGADRVANKDGTLHQHQRSVDNFNRRYGSQGLSADLIAFSSHADKQYTRFKLDQLKGSGSRCDVFYSDVTWTADFAHRGWLMDLSPYVKPRLNSFFPAMRDAAFFAGRYWGVPKQADAGLLYYNTKTIHHPPSTWQGLYKLAARPPAERFRYQGDDYEGLTVNFLELAYAAGADNVVTPHHKAHLDQSATALALDFMVDDGLNQGAVNPTVLDDAEDRSIYAFGHEHVDLMRNWSYAYTKLKRKQYPVADHFRVAPLPRWNGQPRVSVLGGHILVISAFTKHPGAALKLVEYLSSPAVLKQDAIEFSLAPARSSLWDQKPVQRALPAFKSLRTAIETARVRPITPNYDKVSKAIYENVHDALQDRATPDGVDPGTALAAGDQDMQQALDDAYRSPP